MAEEWLNKTPEDLTGIIDKLSTKDSPVGIDARYTHAVIIAYLQDISRRLETLEAAVGRLKQR